MADNHPSQNFRVRISTEAAKRQHAKRENMNLTENLLYCSFGKSGLLDNGCGHDTTIRHEHR